MQVAQLMNYVETAEAALAQVRQVLAMEDPQAVLDVDPPPLQVSDVSLPAVEVPETGAAADDVDAILDAATVPQVSAEQVAELLRVAQALGMTPEEFTAKTREFFGVESLEDLPATGPKSAEVLLASMKKRLSYGA